MVPIRKAKRRGRLAAAFRPTTPGSQILASLSEPEKKGQEKGRNDDIKENKKPAREDRPVVFAGLVSGVLFVVNY